MAKSWDSLDTCRKLVNLIKERTTKVKNENINDITKLFDIAKTDIDIFKSNEILDLISDIDIDISDAGYLLCDIDNIRERNKIFVNLQEKYGNYIDYIDYYDVNINIYFEIPLGHDLDISLDHCEINNRIYDIGFYRGQVCISEYSSIENYEDKDKGETIEHEIDYDNKYDILKNSIYKIMGKCEKVDKLIHFIIECNLFIVNFYNK